MIAGGVPLTAAQPPATTPATRTGESPLSVRPSPPSLLCRQTTRTGSQRARAQNTDRGPCSTEKSRLQLSCREVMIYFNRFSKIRQLIQSLRFTSLWKKSVTWTLEKLVGVMSGF